MKVKALKQLVIWGLCLAWLAANHCLSLLVFLYLSQMQRQHQYLVGLKFQKCINKNGLNKFVLKSVLPFDFSFFRPTGALLATTFSSPFLFTTGVVVGTFDRGVVTVAGLAFALDEVLGGVVSAEVLGGVEAAADNLRFNRSDRDKLVDDLSIFGVT